MTIEEHTAGLERSLRRLSQPRMPWVSADDTAALVQDVKSQVIAADRVLQLPATTETVSARGKLMALTELARGSVKSYEEKGTLI